MTIRFGVDTVDEIDAVLARLRQRGISLRVEGSSLRYVGPRGALSIDEKSALGNLAVRIIARLREENEHVHNSREMPRVGEEERTAPLSFSQFWHWTMFGLQGKQSLRGTTYIGRMCGMLELRELRDSFAAIVRRHAALRTTIGVAHGVPVQKTTVRGRYELECADVIRGSLEELEGEIRFTFEQMVLAPIEFSGGPLFQAKLLKIREDDHVLIMVMDHLISDAYSIGILLREVFTVYAQLVREEPISLPSVAQFCDYAAWQRGIQGILIKNHSRFWEGKVGSFCENRFPTRHRVASGIGLDVVKFRVGRERTTELRNWCRANKTTMAMCFLATYALAVSRWCDKCEVVLQYQTSGRSYKGFENAVGYFASLLCLRIRVFAEDRFIDLLSRVVGDFCDADEHTDLSYMAMDSVQSALVKNTIFNWVPQESEAWLSKIDGLGDQLTIVPIRLENPALKRMEMDSDPEIVMFDSGEEITGELCFPGSRFSRPSMEEFVGVFERLLMIVTRSSAELLINIAFQQS